MADRFTRFMNPLTERTSRPSIVRDGTAYAVRRGIDPREGIGGNEHARGAVLHRIKGRSDCKFPVPF